MLNVLLNQDDWTNAERIVSETNFGQRGKFDGNREQQITGILGELCIYKLLGREQPDYSNPDGFADVVINGKHIDVKTMKRTVDMRDFYVHNFVGYQQYYDVDILLFNSLNSRRGEYGKMQVCGYLSKSDFLNKANYFDKGEKRRRTDGTHFVLKAPLYEIENRLLIPIRNVEDVQKIGK